MKYRDIDIVEYGNDSFVTKGINNIIGYDIHLKSCNNQKGELGLLFFLIDYFLNRHPIIRNNETVSYGLWLLKFCLKGNFFQIHELDEAFSGWHEGADNAVYYYELQKQTCEGESAAFCVPLFTQKIAISSGVLEGKNVQGIRYDEPNHMSGWYITTDEYDGNIANMRVIELQNLVVKRKDLLQFLALPAGFFFETLQNNKCYIGKSSAATENTQEN